MRSSTYFTQLNREMCGTCKLNMTCDNYLRGKGIISCVDYVAMDGTVTCPICGKLIVTGRDIRCPFCQGLIFNPPLWRPLYAKISPEGKILKITKSRPLGGTKEPDRSFSKIVLRRK